MSASKRKQMEGRGTVGKTTVVGMKDRDTGTVATKVVSGTDKETLQDFVISRTEDGTTVFTDDHKSYDGMPNRQHETVKHSVGEHVRDMAHTNGIESFWAILKWAHKGHVPQDQPEAPPPVRCGVCGPPQRAAVGHDRSDEAIGRRYGRKAAYVSGSNCR